MSEVTTNSKMQLSEHFVLGEFTKSSYPEVYNIPSHVAIENMKRICGWLGTLCRSPQGESPKGRLS